MSALPSLVYQFVFGAIIAAIIIGALFYVFYCLGLYTMCKRRGLQYPWLAWIPVASAYIFGKLADEYSGRVEGRQTNYALILLIVSIASFILGLFTGYDVVGGISLAVSIVYMVFYFIAMYRVYNWFSQSSVVLTVLSVIFWIIIPFVLFAIRGGDNRSVMWNGQPQQPYNQPQRPYGQQSPYGQQPYNQQPYGQNPPYGQQQQPPQQPDSERRRYDDDHFV